MSPEAEQLLYLYRSVLNAERRGKKYQEIRNAKYTFICEAYMNLDVVLDLLLHMQLDPKQQYDIAHLILTHDGDVKLSKPGMDNIIFLEIILKNRKHMTYDLISTCEWLVRVHNWTTKGYEDRIKKEEARYILKKRIDRVTNELESFLDDFHKLV